MVADFVACPDKLQQSEIVLVHQATFVLQDLRLTEQPVGGVQPVLDAQLEHQLQLYAVQALIKTKLVKTSASLVHLVISVYLTQQIFR